MVEIKKQTTKDYTIEDGRKVLGWIKKDKLGYNVEFKVLSSTRAEWYPTFIEAKRAAKELNELFN